MQAVGLQWCIAAVFGLATVGCSAANPAFDSGGDAGATTTTSEEGVDSTGEGCGAGELCLPFPGDPWVGPIEVRNVPEVDAGNPCPKARFSSVWDLGYLGDVTIIDPDCCACSDYTYECEYPVLLGHNEEDCSDDGTEMSECASVVDDYGAFSASSKILPRSEQGCSPDPVPRQEPVVDGRLVACWNAAGPTACKDGACFPSGGPAASSCIATVGEVGCPEGWPEQVLFKRYTDTRECDPRECECIPVDGSSPCDVSFDVFNNNNCAGMPTQTHQGSDCQPLMPPNGAPWSVKATTTASDMACNVSNAAWSGGVEESIAFTACCA